MVGSAAIKQGRSANRKHTYFFFWPYVGEDHRYPVGDDGFFELDIVKK